MQTTHTTTGVSTPQHGGVLRPTQDSVSPCFHAEREPRRKMLSSGLSCPHRGLEHEQKGFIRINAVSLHTPTEYYCVWMDDWALADSKRNS
jgi:hypothetical protein